MVDEDAAAGGAGGPVQVIQASKANNGKSGRGGQVPRKTKSGVSENLIQNITNMSYEKRVDPNQ